MKLIVVLMLASYSFAKQLSQGELESRATEVRTQLRDIEGISIGISEGWVVITGEVSASDKKKIEKILNGHHRSAQSLVKLNSQAMDDAVKAIGQKIMRSGAGLRHVQVKHDEENYILEGSVVSALDRDKAETIVRMYEESQVQPCSPSLRQAAEEIGRSCIKNNIVVRPSPEQ